MILVKCVKKTQKVAKYCFYHLYLRRYYAIKIMQYLHLDSQFHPFGNSIAFQSFVFNGGEPHIRIEESLKGTEGITITHRIKTFEDMGVLLLAVDALRRMGVEKINLFLPYFPAARQDRIMTKGEPLSVKVYAELINNLDLNKLTILDPHSEVTPALLNRVEVLENHTYVKQIADQLEDFYLVSPDAGALKKVYKTAQYLGGVEVVEGAKTRDVKTGKLSGFTIHQEDLEGRTCLVVDDICDGGGTFLGLAEQLKAHNAGKLILFVTHGIFSKGSKELAKVYDQIICTNSFKSITDKKIEQIEIR